MTACAVQGVANLFERLHRMASYGPTFCDITWGAGGTTADVTLDIATKMQNMVGGRAAVGGVEQSMFPALASMGDDRGIG